MKLLDLHPLLQNPYSQNTGYGVEKGPENLRHIWFVIPKPPVNVAPQGLQTDLLRAANQTLQKLPRLEVIDEMDKLILSLLVRREAVQSSRMEGTFSTIEQVLAPPSSLDFEKSASSSVLAYAHCLENALNQVMNGGISTIGIPMIRSLHKEMMSRDPEFQGVAGVFRNEIGSGVYATIGGLSRVETSTYNPSPPSYIPHLLEDHFAWMLNEDDIEMSRAGLAPGLLVRLAQQHSHFEAIHPFTDGNGRVGRMLMTLMIASEGYAPLYISGYIEAKKQAYYQALQFAQMKLDETPLVHFICEAIVESYDEAFKTKQALEELPVFWQGRVLTRRDSATRNLFFVLLENPIVTVKLVQEKLNISQPAAKKAIDQLVHGGILRERTGQARNRVFAAEEVIEVLARPFGDLTENALERARFLLTDQ